MSDQLPPEPPSEGASPVPPSEGYGTPPPPPPPPGYGPPPGAMPPAASPSGPQSFDVGQAFSWAWNKFQANLGPILIAMVVYVVITAVVAILAYVILAGALISTASVTVDPNTGQVTTTGGSGMFVSLLVSGLVMLIFMVPFAFLQAGIVRGGLMIADGRRLEVGEMFKFEKIGTIIVAALIVGVASMVGVLLCYVGTLVVAFFTPFYIFFIVDKNLGAWESIMASVNLVKDNLGSVFLLLLLAWVVYAVGAILCGIGLIIAAPVALLALTYGFRKLQNGPVAA